MPEHLGIHLQEEGMKAIGCDGELGLEPWLEPTRIVRSDHDEFEEVECEKIQ